jgi:bifunctional non-homologous end joining protein LigD
MLWRSRPPPARHPPGFIEPCLPTLGHTVPTGSQWAYEIKHDGHRFVCRRERNRVRVFSRRGNDYTERVPRIVDTLARLPVTSVTLDGEGVACSSEGVTDFKLLRAALGRPAKREVFLYAFDLLELDGRDLRREPWSDRRSKLVRLLRGAGHGVQLSDHMESTDGEAAFRHGRWSRERSTGRCRGSVFWWLGGLPARINSGGCFGR